MSTGSDLITLIASRQNLDDYQKKHWTGSFAEYLDIVQHDPRVTRTAYQRIYDMIISHGTEEVVVNKEKTAPLQVLRGPGKPRPGRHLRPGTDPDELCQHPEERRQRLRNGTARAAAARAGRQLQEHAGTAAQEGPGAVFPRRRGEPLQLRVEGRRPRRRRDLAVCPMHEEPLHLIPQEHRVEVTGAPQQRPAHDDFHVAIEGDLCPFCRQMFNERMERYGGDWARVVDDVRVRTVDPLRAGSHRHRHVPAQGREEPGRNRADRRHQLSQDRGVWHRERSARLQFRRRVQHRQPRHHRIHRGPQARRRLPLRSSGCQPGTQDQAQEVCPDRHRRSHHRSYQRAGVQEASVQRVHGGAARPDRQDRRPVRDAAARRGQDLRKGLQQPESPRQTPGAAHARSRRDVGRS